MVHQVSFFDTHTAQFNMCFIIRPSINPKHFYHDNTTFFSASTPSSVIWRHLLCDDITYYMTLLPTSCKRKNFQWNVLTLSFRSHYSCWNYSCWSSTLSLSFHASIPVYQHGRPWHEHTPAAGRYAPLKPSVCDGGPLTLLCRPVERTMNMVGLVYKVNVYIQGKRDSQGCSFVKKKKKKINKKHFSTNINFFFRWG